MNALLPIVTMRACIKCRAEKPVDQFPPKGHACRRCLCDYQRDRMAAIRAGTWRPMSAHERVAKTHEAKATRPADKAVVQAIFEPGTEEALHAAMAAFFFKNGFTALNLAVEKLRTRIARAHRQKLAGEGWIA